MLKSLLMDPVDPWSSKKFRQIFFLVDCHNFWLVPFPNHLHEIKVKKIEANKQNHGFESFVKEILSRYGSGHGRNKKWEVWKTKAVHKRTSEEVATSLRWLKFVFKDIRAGLGCEIIKSDWILQTLRFRVLISKLPQWWSMNDVLFQWVAC